MRRVLVLSGCALALAGCALWRPAEPVGPPRPWNERLAQLARASAWQLDGRAAVAVAQQGWQASLDWRQRGDASEVHLAGPLGVGAMVLALTPAGLSVNGAPPSDAVVAQLQERLGFELPIAHLRYWLLGIPDPRGEFELKLNAQDRALHLAQAGWSIDYATYVPNHGDLLPGRLVLSRADARVRIAVDAWKSSP